MVLYKTNKLEADNIKKIRMENSLSQEQFAKILNEELAKNGTQGNIKARTIQNYESGLYSIPLSVRTAIKERYGIEIDAAPKPDSMRETFKKNLAQTRISRGMDIETLSTLTGCAQYKRYEEGTYIPKLENYVRICLALGISSDYLLGLTENGDKKKNGECAMPGCGNAPSAKIEECSVRICDKARKTKEIFPVNLRTEREKRQMLAHNAAKLTGCLEYPKYENGERLPGLETLYKICQRLGTSSDTLLGLE